MTRLYEEDQLFIYQDEATGKQYLFDGKQLVEMPDNQSSNDSTDPYHIEYDDDEEDTNEAPPGSEPEESSNSNDSKESDEADSSDQDTESSDNNSSEQSSDISDDDSQNSSSDNKSKNNGNGGNDISDTNSENDSSSDVDIDDLDFDNLDWDEIKDDIQDILDKSDDLSQEEKDSFYKELAKHLDEVDKDILDKEEKERQAQIEKETAEYNPNAKDAGPKLQEIADAIADESSYNAIMDEIDSHVYQDRAKRNKEKKKAEMEANKYSASKGVKDFVLDLNRLIKREVQAVTKASYGKINKKSISTGIIKPGKTKRKNQNIPRLFVYFDVSSSWSSNDHQVGIQAIETLNTYVKKGQLIIEIYYFGNEVSTNPNECGGGTGAGAKLIEHVRVNKPDNVCVMTDSDFDRWGEIFEAPRTAVPGGVFLLFRQGDVSRGLIDKLRGRSLNKIYSF